MIYQLFEPDVAEIAETEIFISSVGVRGRAVRPRSEKAEGSARPHSLGLD